MHSQERTGNILLEREEKRKRRKRKGQLPQGIYDESKRKKQPPSKQWLLYKPNTTPDETLTVLWRNAA